jgi:hypothetical protein
MGKKIKDCPLDTAPADDDSFPLQKAGDTYAKRTTRAALLAGLSGGGGGVTAREVDGAPSVVATVVEFNQAQGLTVADQGSGVARVSAADATTLAKGVVQLAASGAATAGRAVEATDARLSDARTPSAHVHAGADITSGTIAAARLPAATTTAQGAVELATDGEVAASLAVQANDARLANARTPTAHNHAASEITSGTIATARLGSGTANSTTFLRGDQTYATPAGGGSAADPLDIVDVADDLLGNSGETGEVGLFGWTFSATANAVISGVSKHPGIFRITTNSSSGSIARIHLGTLSTTEILLPAEVDSLYFLVRPSSVTAGKLKVGLAQDWNSTSGGTDAIWLGFDTTAGASPGNWRAVTRAASTETNTASAVAAVANAWVLLRITRTAGGDWEFYLNGALIATHSTNIPTAALNVGFTVETREAVAKSGDFDAFRYVGVSLGNRWD